MCDVGRKRDLLDWDGLGGRGFLGSIDIAARRCHCRFDAEASFFEADRRRIGSEQMSGKLGRLLFEFLHRVVDGCSADGGAAAAKRADAVLHDRRVSVNDGDVIYIDTELICYELSERCFLALSVWRRSGKHGYLSCGFNSHGRAFPSAGGWESATVRIEPTGQVTVLTGASPHGQGQETSFAQLVADELGIDINDITVIHGDTSIVQYGIGTFGSRGTAVGGTAVYNAVQKLKE